LPDPSEELLLSKLPELSLESEELEFDEPLSVSARGVASSRVISVAAAVPGRDRRFLILRRVVLAISRFWLGSDLIFVVYSVRLLF